MSGKGRANQAKQSTISAFFKAASGNAPDSSKKPADAVSGQGPGDDNGTRPAKKRRVSEGTATQPSTKRGTTGTVAGAAKPSRGAARSCPKSRASEAMDIDQDGGGPVINLLDAATSSEEGVNASHQVEVGDSAGAGSSRAPAEGSRPVGGGDDRAPPQVTAIDFIADTAPPITNATISTAGGGNGLRRLMAAHRRRSGAAGLSAAQPGSPTHEGAPHDQVESYDSVGGDGLRGGGEALGREGGGGVSNMPKVTMMTPQQRERARHKLSQDYGRSVGPEPESTAGLGFPAATAISTPAVKLTPLEQQVVELKAQYPGTLLIVEVGYKMRFFGEDAETAARVCNLWSHMDHNFLTASFPVYRLPVYVRRLCRAGYKVGVVRQTETAAIKAVGTNKSAPFERKVTALYTAATLEAGRRADKIGEEDALDELQDAVPLQPGTSANVLVLAELPSRSSADPHQQQQFANQEMGVLGVLCLDVAGGDVVYGICGGEDGGTTDVTCRRPAAAAAAAVAEDLEALLIAAAPVEVVTVGPALYPATKRLLMNYLSSAPACRLEHMPPPLPSPSPPRNGGDDGLVDSKQQQEDEELAEEGQRQRRKPAWGKAVVAAVAERDKGAAASGGLRGRGAVPTAVGTTVAEHDGVNAAGMNASGVAAAGGDVVAAEWVAAARQELEAFFTEGTGAAIKNRSSALSAFATALPPAVVLATWGALRHLQPFGLTAVLKVNRCWRPLNRRIPPPSTAPDGANGEGAASAMPLLQEMALGPNALRQLEIVSAAGVGNDRGGHSGGADSLLRLMDCTHTAFGSRLLRQWLVRPLCRRDLIVRRQEAVSELLESIEGGIAPLCNVAKALSRLTDVERGFTRALHGNVSPAEFVATVRALQQFRTDIGLQPLPDLPEDLPYEEDYKGDVSGGRSSRGGDSDIHDNDNAGNGFGTNTAAAGAPPCQELGVRSPLLRMLLRQVASRRLSAALAAALQPLDVQAAAANDFGAMFADRERFPEVWTAKDAVAEAEEHLQSLLPSLARAVGLPALSYVSIQNQGTFLVEVPVEAEKRVPKAWHKVCSTKKFHRYHPPDVTTGLQTLGVARERLAAVQSASWLSFLEAFAPTYPMALAAVRAAGQLDVLSSLALLAATPGYCRPEFLPEEEGLAEAPSPPPAEAGPRLAAVLRAREARHPMLDARLSGAMPSRGGRVGGGGGGTAVPNDVELDARDGGCRCLIVTGPNMGGKSCYTRTAALLVVMAQVGSYVPASSLELTVFDGVYTRMGASDNILLGRSTFFEEMSDTAALLAAATPRSLVVLDELGRGTATHDGVAVAEAVLHHLLAVTQCLVLFVTHYPQLAEAVNVWPGAIKACHMSYLRQDGWEVKVAVAKEEEASDREREMRKDEEMSDATAVATTAGALTAVKEEAVPADDDGGSGSGVAATGIRPGTGCMPRITFLYKLEESAADESFGLNVAQMAGLPASVIRRAAEMATGMRRRQEARDRADEEEQEEEEAKVAREAKGWKLACLNPALPDVKIPCQDFPVMMGVAVAGEKADQRHQPKEEVRGRPTGVNEVLARPELLLLTLRRVVGFIKEAQRRGGVGGGGGDSNDGSSASMDGVGAALSSTAPSSLSLFDPATVRDKLIELQRTALQKGLVLV